MAGPARVSVSQITAPPGATAGQLVVVGPDGQTLVTGTAYVTVEGTVGGSTGSGVAGGRDIVTDPVSPTLASGAPAGTVVATLTAPGLTAPTFTGSSSDGTLTIANGKIVAGLVAVDITLGSSKKIKVRAQDSTNENAVEETIVVELTALGAGGPTFDINFLNGVSNGPASLNDVTVVQAASKYAMDADGTSKTFGPNVLRRTGLGLRIDSGAPARYVNKWSADPSQWPMMIWNNPPTVALAQDGLWKPIRVNHNNDAAGSGKFSEQTEPAEIGSAYTVLFKTKPLPEYPNAGATFYILEGGLADSTVPKMREIKVSNMSTNTWDSDNNPYGIQMTVIRSGMQNDGTYELVAQVTAQATDLRFGMSGYNSATTGGNATPLIYYGIVAVKGSAEQPPMATQTGTVVVAGDTVSIGAAISGLIAGTAEGTIFIETYQVETPNGRILTAGSTEVVSFDGYSAVKGRAGAVSAAVAQGGLKGVSIIGVRRTGADLSVVVNGGDIASSAGATNYSGVWKLFETASGWVRRITGYSTALSNETFVARSRTWNRALVNGPKAVVLGQSNVTFEETFPSLASVVALREDPNNFPAVSFAAHVDRYRNKAGRWMDRYVQWTDPAGSAPLAVAYNGTTSIDQGINNEWQYYVDPQWPGYTGYGVAFGEAACPIQVSGGRLRLAAHYPTGGNFPGANALAAVFPNRRARVNGAAQTDTGVKYKYCSGVLTTAPSFQQKGGYFEARIRWDDGLGVWPAFWLLPGSTAGYGATAEIDVLEGVGRVQGRTSSAIHANNYGLNDGTNIDKPYRFKDGYHTFGVEWILGVGCQFYIDGEKTVFKSFVGSNIDDHEMYILLNLAIGDDGGWQGVPDATTDAGFPYYMDVDYVRVWQYV